MTTPTTGTNVPTVPATPESKNRALKRKSRTAKGKSGGLITWLERYACAPEFAGGMLGFLSMFFFFSATNTLSGWLYVISGVSFALLLIGAIMPAIYLREITVTRSRIEPVSAGEEVFIELIITNVGKSLKSLLQVQDFLPSGIGQGTSVSGISKTEMSKAEMPQTEVIERLEAGKQYRWSYAVTTVQRGKFTFDRLQLITASPFGLFRSRRSPRPPQSVQSAIVYPTVLPLNQCPLIDQIGREDSHKLYSPERVANAANEGLTRTLRPYRWGDPIRLVHWRSSARFGELRVRELEVTIGGQELAIALDEQPGWQASSFEEVVIAAASLYFYAQHLNLQVSLWTATTGLLQGSQQVLETLAVINPQPDMTLNKDLKSLEPPDLPLVWITHRANSLGALPAGSRWLLWQEGTGGKGTTLFPGLAIASQDSEDLDPSYTALRSQLQSRLHT